MARVEVEDEIEDAADEMGDEPEDDSDDDSDDDEDEITDEDGADAYDKLAGRLQVRIDKQVAKYKLNQATRLAKYIVTRSNWRQRRLDEYALGHIGSASISNPGAVAESIDRQVAQAEERLAALQAQKVKLAELMASGGEGEVEQEA